MAEYKYYLGMDLCAEYTQLSFYNEEEDEPESIYQLENMETYLLPNVMFYGYTSKTWYVGSKAAKYRFEEDGYMVDKVVSEVSNSDKLIIDGREYTYKQLFLLLIKGHIEDYINRRPDTKVAENLAKLVICIYKYNGDLYGALEDLPEVLGVSPEVIENTSRINSYVHYVFNQPAELRNNSVALFDYSVDGLDYYRIDTIRQGSKPEIIDVIHKDLRTEIPFDMVYGDRDELDNRFAKVAEDILKETYVSSVYLTGTGFVESWLKKSTNVICSGRRVFVGQNIYTKGACYAAYSGESIIEPSKYTLCTENTVICDIGVSKREDKIDFAPIAYGGREWYNMSGHLELFMSDTNKIYILYRNRITDKTSKEIIEIHGLPKRPDKTTKLSLDVEFYSNTEGAITIRDIGFGKMYPTTNKVYRKDFVIEN